MTNIEKGAAILGAVIIIFGAGAGWNNLSNRIEQVDNKVGDIQRTLGSTTCSAILTRQIAAIERGNAPAREALEALSEQHRCIPEADAAVAMSYNMAAEAPMEASAKTNATLVLNQLEAVDVLLNEQN